MQPLPACARKATELLGQGGELVVLPNTHRGVMEKVARFGFRPDVVASILATGQAVITGSFLLHHLMIGAKWTPGDLDIFGSQAALDVAKFWMWKPDKVSCTTAYGWGSEGLRKNVTNIVQWTSDTGKKLQFVCVKGDLEETIQGFDLPLVRSWFDGLFVFVPKATHEALQKRACALQIPANVTVNGRTFSDHLFVGQRLGRAIAYAARGFAIQLPRNIAIQLPRNLFVEYVAAWDAITKGDLFSELPEVRALLRWAYFVPKTERRASEAYKVAYRAYLASLHKACSSTLQSSRRSMIQPPQEPVCTLVRRKGRTWLTRADVLALRSDADPVKKT
jgi:hypothetical protein